MIRFRLLSTSCAAHYFSETFLRAGNWDPGFGGSSLSLFYTLLPPSHSCTFLQHHTPTCPPKSAPAIPQALSPIILCTPSRPAMQLLASQPVCLFQDFCVWGGWVVMVVCLRGGALVKEYIGDYVNRQVPCWG